MQRGGFFEIFFMKFGAKKCGEAHILVFARLCKDSTSSAFIHAPYNDPQTTQILFVSFLLAKTTAYQESWNNFPKNTAKNHNLNVTSISQNRGN